MKIRLANIDPSSFGPNRKVFVIRNTRWGPIAQAWPRKRPRNKPWQIYQQWEFGGAAKMATNPHPLDYETSVNLCKGRTNVPRDFLTAIAMGTLYDIEFPDGTKWTPRRHMANIQLLLDDITTEVGAMIWRSAAGWILIEPGAIDDVLTITPDGPEWQPAQGGGGGGGIPAFNLYDPPDPADYTLNGTNSNDPTFTFIDGAGTIISFGASPAGGDNLRSATRPIPATLPALISYGIRGLAANVRHQGFGIVLKGSGVGGTPRTYLSAMFNNRDASGSPAPWQMTVTEWTNATTWGTNVVTIPIVGMPNYLHLSLTSTTYQFLMSMDAQTLLPLMDPATYTSFITPTDEGVCALVNPQDNGFKLPFVTANVVYQEVAN